LKKRFGGTERIDKIKSGSPNQSSKKKNSTTARREGGTGKGRGENLRQAPGISSESPLRKRYLGEFNQRIPSSPDCVSLRKEGGIADELQERRRVIPDQLPTIVVVCLGKVEKLTEKGRKLPFAVRRRESVGGKNFIMPHE